MYQNTQVLCDGLWVLTIAYIGKDGVTIRRSEVTKKEIKAATWFG